MSTRLLTLTMSLSSLVTAELANAEADFPTENVKVTSSSGGLESIYFNTASCIGCEDTGVVEDGLRVTLLSQDGSGCVTEGLDNPHMRDYFPGNLAIFDSVEDGLADCAGAVLEGGPLGGSVMWTGQVILACHSSKLYTTLNTYYFLIGRGVFSAMRQEICIELANGENGDWWCCNMEDTASATFQPVLLHNCTCDLGNCT